METHKGEKYNSEMVTGWFIIWSRKQFQLKNLTASTWQRIQPKRIGQLLANSNNTTNFLTEPDSESEDEVDGPGEHQEEFTA